MIEKFLREEYQFLLNLLIFPTILPPPVFCRPRRLRQSPSKKIAPVLTTDDDYVHKEY